MKNNIFTYKSPNDATGFLLYRVHAVWQRLLQRKLKPLGITHTQFVLMANIHWLSAQKEQVTQIVIANHAKMDVMMTSNVIRILEKKELISRKNHKTDTRAKVVSLTKKGFKVLKDAVLLVEDFDREFFNKIENVATFNNQLMKLLN